MKHIAMRYAKFVSLFIVAIVVLLLNAPVILTNKECATAIADTVVGYNDITDISSGADYDVVLLEFMNNHKFIDNEMLSSLDYIKLVNYAYATYYIVTLRSSSESLSEADSYIYDVLTRKAVVWDRYVYKNDMILSNLRESMIISMNSDYSVNIFSKLYNTPGIKLLVYLKAVSYDICVNEPILRRLMNIISIVIVIIAIFIVLYIRLGKKEDFLDEEFDMSEDDIDDED